MQIKLKLNRNINLHKLSEDSSLDINEFKLSTTDWEKNTEDTDRTLIERRQEMKMSMMESVKQTTKNNRKDQQNQKLIHQKQLRGWGAAGKMQTK